MGWLMGWKVIFMRVRWAGVGWFVARDNLVVHAGGRFMCRPFWFVLGCDQIHAVLQFVLLICLCMQCWTTLMVSVFDFALTQILLLFLSLSFVWLWFVFFFICWMFCWMFLFVLIINEWQEGLVQSMWIQSDNNCNQQLCLSLPGGKALLLFLTTATHNSFVCLLDIFLLLFCSTQKYTVLLWPWQSPSVGVLGLAGFTWTLTTDSNHSYHHTHIKNTRFSRVFMFIFACLTRSVDWHIYDLSLQLSDVAVVVVTLHCQTPTVQ